MTSRAKDFMPANDLFFVIPTYRLRDVGETVEHYDEHFWRNGHSVRMIVFDDSSPVNQEKYYPLLEQTRRRITSCTTSGRGRRSSSSPTSTAGCATSGWKGWSRTCFAPATAAIATTR